MKKKFLKFKLILVVVFFSTTITYSQSAKEIYLKQVTENADTTMAVKLNVDTAQEASEYGLRFSVTIYNNSNGEIEIKNPLDFIQFRLKNKDGKEVNIPEISRFLINTRSPISRNVTLEKALLNNQLIETDVINPLTTTIPAYSAYTLFFDIKNILKPDATKPYTQDQRIQIVNDSYGLYIFLGIHANGTSKRTVFHLIQRVLVNYGLSY